MILACKQTPTRKFDAMSKRKYTIKRDAGTHLTQRMRETLGTAWNQYVNRLTPISLREFARLHNVPYETWRREFNRGAVSPVIRRGNRWTYPEYDLGKATASINEGSSATVLGVTTDSGCEFLDQKRLDRLFKAKVYYTRAYASYEKGSIENCNRLVR